MTGWLVIAWLLIPFGLHAQSIAWPDQPLDADAALERQIPALARKLLAGYQDPDRERQAAASGARRSLHGFPSGPSGTRYAVRVPSPIDSSGKPPERMRLDTSTASFGSRDTLASKARRASSIAGACVSHHSRASRWLQAVSVQPSSS